MAMPKASSVCDWGSPYKEGAVCEGGGAPLWEWSAVARPSLSGTSSMAWEVGGKSLQGPCLAKIC